VDTVIVGMSNNSITASAARYQQLFGQLVGWATTSTANSTTVASCAGTLSKLYIKSASGPGAGLTRTYVIEKNGVDQALTCSQSDTTTTANDTLNTVSFSAGDALSLKTTASGTTTGSGAIKWTLLATCASNVSLVGSTAEGTLANGATSYMPVQGNSNALAAASVTGIMPTDGTFRNARLLLNGSPGGSASYTLTLQKNGVNTAITMTVSGTSTTASDLSDSASYSAGDTINWEVVPAGTPTARNCNIGIEFDPTINGESIAVFGNPNSASASAVRFMVPQSAGGTYSSTEDARSTLVQACTIKKFYVAVSTAPTTGNSLQFQISINNSAGNPSVTISDTNTSGSDTVNTVSPTVGQTLAVKITPFGTPALGTNRWGFVYYIAPPASSTRGLLMMMGVGQ
jgi:hypothetical protein